MTRRYVLDLLERVGSTAAQAALAVLLPILVAGGLPDSTQGKAALIAGLAAAAAVVKGLLASFVGSRNTASLLPAKDQPAAAEVHVHVADPDGTVLAAVHEQQQRDAHGRFVRRVGD